MWRGIVEWEYLVTNLTHKFEFDDAHPIADVVLQVIREKIFFDIPVDEANSH